MTDNTEKAKVSKGKYILLRNVLKFFKNKGNQEKLKTIAGNPFVREESTQIVSTLLKQYYILKYRMMRGYSNLLGKAVKSTSDAFLKLVTPKDPRKKSLLANIAARFSKGVDEALVNNDKFLSTEYNRNASLLKVVTPIKNAASNPAVKPLLLTLTKNPELAKWASLLIAAISMGEKNIQSQQAAVTVLMNEQNEKAKKPAKVSTQTVANSMLRQQVEVPQRA